MKRIDISTPTYPNMFTIVDDEDFEELSKHKWCVMKLRYGFAAVRRKSGKTILMHRQITNAPKSMDVDHINHDTLFNCRCNLRVCTNSQNHQNQRKTRGTSKYKGVSWYKDRQKWCAEICLNYKKYRLGTFINEIDAAKAYDKKAKELFGEFAKLNDVQGVP